MNLKKLTRDIDFADKVEELSGQSLNACIQCGTCAAGCPFVEDMDILPERVFKHIILGDIEKVLEHNTMWICAACYTCSVRCPRDIDIAKIMEAVRQIVLRANIDRAEVDEVDNMEELPQLAVVGCFRKETG
ncbi:MAG: 4Fe-4S dicluster domain-containing protein [Candidatus Thermoplasmatota archaeon]|nr:4Fe-4S dicluster domain-containing protein [Candidatus Thermoplasmatota archaeon]